MDDQYKIQKVYTPKPATRVPLAIEQSDNSDIKQPSEEDTGKITIILGNLKVNLAKDPRTIPQEILDEMNNQEKNAITEAFKGRIEEKFGNRIEITCKTRKDALMLAK